MKNVIKGIMRDVAFKMVQEDGTSIYSFRLLGGDERFTMCDNERIPQANDHVLIFLHPADSPWPLHAMEVVFDVPLRVIMGGETK